MIYSAICLFIAISFLAPAEAAEKKAPSLTSATGVVLVTADGKVYLKTTNGGVPLAGSMLDQLKKKKGKPVVIEGTINKEKKVFDVSKVIDATADPVKALEASKTQKEKAKKAVDQKVSRIKAQEPAKKVKSVAAPDAKTPSRTSRGNGFGAALGLLADIIIADQIMTSYVWDGYIYVDVVVPTALVFDGGYYVDDVLILDGYAYTDSGVYYEDTYYEESYYEESYEETYSESYEEWEETYEEEFAVETNDEDSDEQESDDDDEDNGDDEEQRL